MAYLLGEILGLALQGGGPRHGPEILNRAGRLLDRALNPLHSPARTGGLLRSSLRLLGQR